MFIPRLSESVEIHGGDGDCIIMMKAGETPD
jgi:hypothetical protein